MSHPLSLGKKAKTIGVLALQGAYDSHIRHLVSLGLSARKVRDAHDLEGLDGLVLPGGESSVMLTLIERRGLLEPLTTLIDRGVPVLATCAGLILLAEKAYADPSRSREQRSLKRLSVTVERNGWGRQIESGLRVIDIREDLKSVEPTEMMFVRAPKIIAVNSNIEIIGTLNGEPVWVRQGSIHAMCGHPELSDDPWVHRQCFI